MNLTVESKIGTCVRNSHYVSNREDLVPSSLIKLPAGSIKAKGFLKEYLDRQKNGLTGQLPHISKWLQRKDNAWLSPKGKGKWGWEEVPYWLKGYISLGYALNDKEIIEEAHFWIEATLKSQRKNGDFGPNKKHFKNFKRDYWSNMIMLFCLQTYYEYTEDERVLDFMINFFKHINSLKDKDFLPDYWDRLRGGDMLYTVIWLYNRRKEDFLIEVAEKIHRNTGDWMMKGDLPDYHNVNVAQCFREPATYYVLSKNKEHLKATYDNYHEIRKRFGDVPGGMFGGDENCRKGYEDPRQGVETCGLVEQMLSDELLLQITGDTFWADNCEDVAYNTYPAAIMPDFKALRYVTCPNHVMSDKENHHPGIDNKGPFLMMNPFSSRCCQHNHSHGWPYFLEHQIMATPDNGVAFPFYNSCQTEAKVGNGSSVKFDVDTNYPFFESVLVKFNVKEKESFPLYFRIPGWCKKVSFRINGKETEFKNENGKYIKLEGEWEGENKVLIFFSMELTKVEYKKHNAVGVNYGSLSFSVKIEENKVQQDSTKTAIWDSGWQKGSDPSQWPSYELFPGSPWNYGLCNFDFENMRLNSMEMPQNNFPFTQEDCPLEVVMPARQIKNWGIDEHGLCDVLPKNPEIGDTQIIKLIPMGAARLRVSAFPKLD